MVDNVGERGTSRNLMHSTSSFSLNKRRRSEIERSFIMSRDMVEVVAVTVGAHAAHVEDVPERPSSSAVVGPLSSFLTM